MRRICTGSKQWVRACVFVALALASGCTRFAPLEEVHEPEPVSTGEVAPVEAPPPATSPPPVQTPEPRTQPPVAILLADSQPAYADVAAALAEQIEAHAVYDLSDASLPPISVLRSINDSESATIVAIGLQAAQSAVSFSNLPVVFAQVFNHQDYDLLNDNSRGVSALVPAEAQLDAWQQIYPDRQRIGLIIGEGYEEMLEAATLAAELRGIELAVRVSRSDQETVYAFRRMIHDIDGFWLFPDNRILSARALQEILSGANRLAVPVGVPNDAMLPMGASFSITSVATDIAETIAGLLSRIQAGEIDTVPPMTELSEIRITVADPAPSDVTVVNRKLQ